MSRRDTAKLAVKAEQRMEKAEIPGMKETAEIATHVVKSANTAVINFSPSGPMF